MEESKSTNEWEVLTPTGWQDFDGVKKTHKNQSITIVLDNNQQITCSPLHQLFIKRYDEEGFLAAEIIDETDAVLHKDGKFHAIQSIEKVDEEVDMYDLINVRNGYAYYTNDIVSHNCAHIENVDDLWLGLQPGLSTGGSAILLSTPSGVGTLFHKLWIAAKDGENDFYPIELPWDVHPERDQAWFEEQKKSIIAAKGEMGVAQELMCSFSTSGDTFLKADVLQRIFNNTKMPIGQHKKDPNVWIWKYVQSNHRYLLAADVARGTSEDFSAFHVIDMDADEVVCEYKGKIPPDKFAHLMVDVAKQYNDALICQELNNVGIAAAITLKHSGYKNLFYQKVMKNAFMTYNEDDVIDENPGIETTVNNRTEILARLENSLRNNHIQVYSERLHKELQTFIWKNNKPQARKGYNDDLTLALAIGVSLYEAGEKNTHGSDEMAKAMLAGMSRDTKDPLKTDNWSTSFNPGQLSGQFTPPGSTTSKMGGPQQSPFRRSGQQNGQNIPADLYKWLIND